MEALEDTHADVLKKAMVGQLMPINVVAENLGMAPELVRNQLDGEVDLVVLRKLAVALGLAPEALCAIAENRWSPNVNPPKDLIRITSEFRGGTVNAFIAYDTSGDAIIVDTGMSAEKIIEAIAQRNLRVRAILITHAHTDHVFALDALKAAFPVSVYAIDSERFVEASRLQYKMLLEIGSLRVRVIETIGHAADGASFEVFGLENPVVFSGDALFAGSMGGGMFSYRQAIETTGANLLSLEPETIVCPGHGPLTTIGLEGIHNAFFGE